MGSRRSCELQLAASNLRSEPSGQLAPSRDLGYSSLALVLVNPREILLATCLDMQGKISVEMSRGRT